MCRDFHFIIKIHFCTCRDIKICWTVIITKLSTKIIFNGCCTFFPITAEPNLSLQSFLWESKIVYTFYFLNIVIKHILRLSIGLQKPAECVSRLFIYLSVDTHFISRFSKNYDWCFNNDLSMIQWWNFATVFLTLGCNRCLGTRLIYCRH